MHVLSLEIILDVIGWTFCGSLERIVALPAHTMTKALAQFHLVEMHSSRRIL
jgi:hypothetical protein